MRSTIFYINKPRVRWCLGGMKMLTSGVNPCVIVRLSEGINTAKFNFSSCALIYL